MIIDWRHDMKRKDSSHAEYRRMCSRRRRSHIAMRLLMGAALLISLFAGIFGGSSAFADEVLGVSLPAPLGSTFTAGGPPNYADTYVTPYVATQNGDIATWKAQFMAGSLTAGCGLPVGIQLKVLRAIPATTRVQVIGAGTVHDPRPTLQARFGGTCPSFRDDDEGSVIEFTDSGLTVSPDDIIGLTIKSDPDVGGYLYPLVDASFMRLVVSDVAVGDTIDLADRFTGTLPNLGPGLQVILVSGPTANAGPDQAIHAGQPVTLDGSQSFDDNTPTAELLFTWTLASRPEGSAAALAGADTVSPTFVADLPGTYVLSLVVTDVDSHSSTPDTVVVSSVNAAPTANAGTQQAAVVGQTVTLDGSTSTDPDGDSLSFSWTLATPAGSAATLSGATTAAPSFVPEVPGTYTATLTVSDGFGGTSSASVTVSGITAAEFAETEIAQSQNVVGSLPASSVTTTGNQAALQNFLAQAIAALQAGDVRKARLKLQQAIERTDGCVLRGSADGKGPGRDWVTDCAAQAELYENLTAALAALTP